MNPHHEPIALNPVRSIRKLCLNCLYSFICLFSATLVADEPFRPERGKFPPLDKANSYRGELVTVDHASRQGTIRVQGSGMFFRNDPQRFAMLPYGMVRYHGAPADLRDVPTGTVMHVWAFLPPDPKTSSVPVLPLDNVKKNDGMAPAENHVMLLEDELSRCQREGKVWKLKEVELQSNGGMIIARRESKESSDSKSEEEKLTFDFATRVWRGRECLAISDLIAEGIWPASGKKSLEGLAVQLGIIWKPTPDGIFARFHISDIWLDEVAVQRAGALQTETHKAFIRSRWMPAWVDGVEYGKFGRATVTVTLFGGMDPSLYADFKKDGNAMMNAAKDSLKHTDGDYGPAHMSSRGKIVEVIKADGEAPLGSSGIQIRFETDLVIEGLRSGRVALISPSVWPQVNLPREEYKD